MTKQWNSTERNSCYGKFLIPGTRRGALLDRSLRAGGVPLGRFP